MQITFIYIVFSILILFKIHFTLIFISCNCYFRWSLCLFGFIQHPSRILATVQFVESRLIPIISSFIYCHKIDIHFFVNFWNSFVLQAVASALLGLVIATFINLMTSSTLGTWSLHFFLTYTEDLWDTDLLPFRLRNYTIGHCPEFKFTFVYLFSIRRIYWCSLICCEGGRSLRTCL